MQDAGPRWQRPLRFLCGGAANTLLSYLLYLALVQVLPYQWAYLGAYVAGIVFAYWVNARFVFEVPLSWKGLFSYPVIYLVQYVIAAGLLEVAVRVIGLPTVYAPILVTAILFPITYLLNKLLLGRLPRGASRDRHEKR